MTRSLFPLLPTLLENPGYNPPGGGGTRYAVSFMLDSEKRMPLPCIVPWAAPFKQPGNSHDWAWDTSSGLITL